MGHAHSSGGCYLLDDGDAVMSSAEGRLDTVVAIHAAEPGSVQVLCRCAGEQRGIQHKFTYQYSMCHLEAPADCISQCYSVPSLVVLLVVTTSVSHSGIDWRQLDI